MSREDYQTTRYRVLKTLNLCVGCARCKPLSNFVRCQVCLNRVYKAKQAYCASGKDKIAYQLKKIHSRA